MEKEKNKKNTDLQDVNVDEKDKFKKPNENAKVVEKEIIEMQKMSYEKKKKRNFLIAILIGILIIILLIFSTIFAFLNINNDKIIKGISIEGVDVSGLSADEAKNKLVEIYNQKKNSEIKVKHGEFETTISPILLEVDYKIDDAVNYANSIGKDSNIFINNYNILLSSIMKKNINVEMTLNEDVAKQSIEDMNSNLPDVVVDSSYSVDGDELTISKGKAGVKINTDEFLDKIKENLKNINTTDETIEIPVKNEEPEEINIEKIHDEICKEPKDAYYTKEPFAVYPEVKGISFDIEKAKEILSQDKQEYVIKLTVTNPKVTLDKIGPEAFPNKLGTFTTRYDVSDKDRSTNLQLACNKINGTVVLSGDTFSYNKVVGARTEGAGYKNAKVYESGKVVDGIGGGICQISSTLYNAVLMSNLEIVERKNHQFITSYVPAGRDATVVYGITDFKFKNTRKYPVRIVATAKDGIATVSIYGIKEDAEYEFKFTTKTVATIPYTTEYVDDSTLPTGTEKVIQKGTNGLKTETYITKTLNGKTVSTTLLSKDTYSAMTRIVKRGTGASSTPQTKDKEITKENEEILVAASNGKLIRFNENDYESALNQLEEIISEFKVEKIVLGLPKNMNNSLGFASERSMNFKKMIEEKYNIEVILQDERLSSVEANNIMIKNDTSRKKRKKSVDSLAANIILQSYLDKIKKE